MKKFLYSIYFFFTLALILSPAFVSASTFPNDAKEIALDTHSGTAGTLLATSTGYRTILFSSITTNATDGHICISPAGSCSANPAIVKLQDTEGTANSTQDRFHSYLIPPGTEISWNKSSTGDKLFVSLVYVDYNLASSTESATFNGVVTIASSTLPLIVYDVSTGGGSASSTFPTLASSTMTNSIENIGYTATTTQTAFGVTVTQAVYSFPYLLFKFILFLIVLSLPVVTIYLFYRKLQKRYDACAVYICHYCYFAIFFFNGYVY